MSSTTSALYSGGKNRRGRGIGLPSRGPSPHPGCPPDRVNSTPPDRWLPSLCLRQLADSSNARQLAGEASGQPSPGGHDPDHCVVSVDGLHLEFGRGLTPLIIGGLGIVGLVAGDLLGRIAREGLERCLAV